MARDWAEKEVEARSARRQAKQIQDEKALSDRRLKERASASKWQALKAALKEKMLEFNKLSGEEVLVDHTVSLSEIEVKCSDTQRVLQFRNDPGSFALAFTVNHSDGMDYKLEFKGRDEIEYQSRSGDFKSVEVIAENALSQLLRSGQ